MEPLHVSYGQTRRREDVPPEISRGPLRRRQAEIRNAHLFATARDENVFRLQVAVEDAHEVAVLDGIDDLEKDFADEVVPAEILDVSLDILCCRRFRNMKPTMTM